MRCTCSRVLLVLCVITTPLHAVELSVAVKAALALTGTIEIPRLMHDMCVARSPATAAETTASYMNWKERRDPLLVMVKAALETRGAQLAPLPDSTTAGEITDLNGVIAFIERELRRQAEAKGDEYMDQVCGDYPNFLSTIDSRFEERLSSQVEALRQSLPTERTYVDSAAVLPFDAALAERRR